MNFIWIVLIIIFSLRIKQMLVVKLSMDVRWQELSDLGLRLSDFEVVAQ